jgi:hypothetical protein
MQILDYRNASDLEAMQDAWERLCRQERRFVPSLSEISGDKFRLLVAVDNDVVGMACFVYVERKKNFEIAQRKLFDLPVKVIALLGSCMLGQLPEDVIAKFLHMVINESQFDFLDLGEIVVDSPLYKVVVRLSGSIIVSKVSRQSQNSIRWLIKLPGSFRDYCSSLGAATQKNNVVKFKQFERQSAFAVHVIHRPDQVEAFLQDGEKLSRLSYQWNLNMRLCNDEATRKRLTQRAQAGLLRCYILYLHGEPYAFAYGEMSHKVFLYQLPGYDPKYAHVSPGTILMLWIIRDLIDNTDCEFFDFGMGNHEYKQRYGNTCLNVSRIQLSRWRRPYSLLLVSLDRVLNLAKNFANAIIGGDSKLKQRLRKASRRYG